MLNRPDPTTLFNSLRIALRANPNLISVYYADPGGYFFQVSNDIKQDTNPNNTVKWTWSYVLGNGRRLYYHFDDNTGVISSSMYSNRSYEARTRYVKKEKCQYAKKNKIK